MGSCRKSVPREGCGSSLAIPPSRQLLCAPLRSVFVHSISPQKVWAVSKYEFDESIASRLLLFVLILYVGGSALACGLFLKGFEQAELHVRETLASELGVSIDEIPGDLVRERAVPALLKLVGDAELQSVLSQMPLFSIFYTLVAMSSVALLVLSTSSGAHASDLASGSVRFALPRCDRPSWVVGKFAGQALVLLLGLLAGGAAAGAVGLWLDPHFSPLTWPWLLRGSLAAWTMGLAYLGLFSAVSLLAKTVMKARMYALFALMGSSVAHTIVDSGAASRALPGIELLRWVFPAQYKQGLWMNSGALALSVGALLLMSGLALFLGTVLFERRDA